MTLPEILLTRTDADHLPFSEWTNPIMGRRNKLGGLPDAIQELEIPKCSCHKSMSFYGQLDSINNEYSIGDMGLIYVFYCFDCLEAKAIVDSY